LSGHFLQMVWPTAKYFGIGTAYTTDEKKAFTVARFDDALSSGEVKRKEIKIPEEIDKSKEIITLLIICSKIRIQIFFHIQQIFFHIQQHFLFTDGTTELICV